MIGERIKILEKNCISCYYCEVACITEHSKSKDPVKAYKDEGLRFKKRVVINVQGALSVPFMCLHCRHPWCQDACISGAISQIDKKVLLDEDRCVGCWGCILACPYGAVHPNVKNNYVFKCDFCHERALRGLKPACVEVCPNKALVLEEIQLQVPSKSQNITILVNGGDYVKSKYLIIGANVAAVGCIDGIRSVDGNSEITIVSYEKTGCYSKSLLADYLKGKDVGHLTYRPQEYLEKYGVKSIWGMKATKIDFEKKQVIFGKTKLRIGFENLLLAVGGVPIKPEIKGAEGKEDVYTFTEFSEVDRLRKNLRKLENFVVVGAGFTGTEVAYALKKMGKDITVVELMDRPLPMALDKDSSHIVENIMKEEGIRFIFNDSVTEILGKEKVKGVKLKSGKKITCDAVVISIGVLPNGELKNGKLNFDRGFVVDETMKTNIDNIYAAGDCASAYDITIGKNRSLALWPLAYLQGKVAGKNMAGKRTVYPGGLPLNSLKFLKLPVVSAGLTNPPPDKGYEVIVKEGKNYYYRRTLVIKDNKLKGFVSLGEIDGAGILTMLIRSGMDVSGFKDKLLFPKIHISYLPADFRKEKFINDKTDIEDTFLL